MICVITVTIILLAAREVQVFRGRGGHDLAIETGLAGVETIAKSSWELRETDSTSLTAMVRENDPWTLPDPNTTRTAV